MYWAGSAEVAVAGASIRYSVVPTIQYLKTRFSVRRVWVRDMDTHCVAPCRWQPVTAETDGRAVVDGALACEVIEGGLVVWAPTTESPLKRYKAKRR